MGASLGNRWMDRSGSYGNGVGCYLISGWEWMPTCINLSEPKCHVRLGLLSHFVSRVPSTGGGVLVLALFEWVVSHISVAMYSSAY
jgi:hypothetical protein